MAEEALKNYHNNPQSIERLHIPLKELEDVLNYEQKAMEKFLTKEATLGKGLKDQKSIENHFWYRLWTGVFGLIFEMTEHKTPNSVFEWDELHDPFESKRYEELKSLVAFAEAYQAIINLEAEYFYKFIKQDKLSAIEIDLAYKKFEKCLSQFRKEILALSSQFPAINLLKNNPIGIVKSMKRTNRPEDIFSFLIASIELAKD